MIIFLLDMNVPGTVEEINLVGQHGKKITITTSFVAASFYMNVSNIKALIQVAAIVLYGSRRNGRNKVSRFQPNYSEILNKVMGVRACLNQ
jgi:hypothetical protein